jgi:maltooligosyltrehalose trehalohydrolase
MSATRTDPASPTSTQQYWPDPLPSNSSENPATGATLNPSGGARFRVWAPRCTRLEVIFTDSPDQPVSLETNGDGYFSGSAEASLAQHGKRYKFRLNGKELFPDPWSRFQPDGPHGDSQLWDSRRYKWQHCDWPGVSLKGQVLYELHIGTFTSERTYAAAEARLPLLKEAGITVIELMPLAEFPGNFGWGYDGVKMFAPYHGYGTPDDLRHFVDTAHGLGLGVLLDVVYNHLGPDGNYIGQFTGTFFADKHHTPWGHAINYDAEGSQGTREFVLSNAAYWVREFNFDGLRLDATQTIFDDSPRRGGTHILRAIGEAVRTAAQGRETIIVAEDDERRADMMRPEGYALDGVWNDDFHHSARVALTGRRPFYLGPFQGSAQELVSAAKYGFLHAGQTIGDTSGQTVAVKPGETAGPRRLLGQLTFGVPLWRFVNYIENHDQVSAETKGSRLRTLTSAAAYRAMSTYLLLGPGTPMLFQGQEFGSTTPFPYFADHGDALRPLVRDGRWDFLREFIPGATKEMAEELGLPDPGAESTAQAATLDWSERDREPALSALYKDLIALRKHETIFVANDLRVDGAILAERCLLLRYWRDAGSGQVARLLVVNLGDDVDLPEIAEPLLGTEGGGWEMIFSSEDQKYGGTGSPNFEDTDGWHMAARSAVFLAPRSTRSSG